MVSNGDSATHHDRHTTLNNVELKSPSLPAELEREIFETAAFLDPKGIPRLLLISHSVYTWLEPFLYHVLAFRKDRLDPGPTKPIPMEPILKAISAKPPHFFASHVRHLAVNNNVPRALVDYILSVCTGIDNLALFNGDSTPSLMPLVDRIRPRRFSVNMRGLFGGAPDFTHPMFSKTTHLDVSDTFGDEWVAWNRLASLAHLTHLSFNYSDEALPGGLFHELLRDCKLLQALIIVWPSLLRFEYEAEVGEYPTQDPRFVMIVCGSYFADWLDGARGGEDFWARADNFIARKRRGEVAAEVCLLDDNRT